MNVKSLQHPAPGSLVPLLEQRLEAAKEQFCKLQTELERAQEQVSVYERALAIEMVKVAEQVPYQTTNRWVLFERFCEMHRLDGFTRPQLALFYRDQQIAIGKNFPYQAVRKWGSQLAQKGDRFFLRTPDPHRETDTLEQSPAMPSRKAPRPMGDLIKAVEGVIQILDLIDSRTIYAYLKKQRYEFGAKRPIASIAATLRRLEIRGKLTEVQKGIGTYPGQYRKTADIQTSSTKKANAN